jgi:hypothetical protein
VDVGRRIGSNRAVQVAGRARRCNILIAARGRCAPVEESRVGKGLARSHRRQAVRRRGGRIFGTCRGLWEKAEVELMLVLEKGRNQRLEPRLSWCAFNEFVRSAQCGRCKERL